ncbi:unnamed protein product [Pleuronectes platessa]|uniref:Uncharacterized protein n=1 Tax=Pleuronectes platessa TaxID=8262 RepID=A0A9N7V4A7_PLEPL|nr:unnamed protein product [Pleuronectes platessa]
MTWTASKAPRQQGRHVTEDEEDTSPERPELRTNVNEAGDNTSVRIHIPTDLPSLAGLLAISQLLLSPPSSASRLDGGGGVDAGLLQGWEPGVK